jgi:hypothetical protein
MTPAPAAAVKNTRCAMVAKNYVLKTLFMLLIVLSVIACDEPKDDFSVSFWARNFSTEKDYKLKAELLVSGKYCNVWVEKGNSTGKAQAKNIADAYDNKVHLQMISAFGLKNPKYNGRTFSDIMKFADYLGDGDGKLCILLLDIKDDYKGVNDTYVAGYFWAGDFLNDPKYPSSNLRDMIYIDTNPGMDGGKIDRAVTTLAHEMQHLMNFVTSVITRVIDKGDGKYIYPMNLWIDEGLSSAAEYIINNRHSTDRISWYNRDGAGNTIKGLIDKGNNFYVWGNRRNESIYAVLDDYATVYLFFQWLRIQKGNNSIYYDIISSNCDDYQAVTTAAGETWDNLLKNWMAANYINSDTGTYGYKGEIPITAHYAPINAIEFFLYPGEGVYSLTDTGDTIPSQGTNIRYAGLNKNGTVSDSTVYTKGALLTYNRNSELEDFPEKGMTTGKAPSANIASSNERSIMSSYSGPLRIGAGDVLRWSGDKNDFALWNFQDRLKEDAIVE